MAKNKKFITSVVAVATAAALLLSGTFAWQSINQTALNEASDVINPGGRLHDDFDGTNKDIYVENFADEDIFARIQLSEYFALIANYGVEGAEKRNELVGTLKDGTYTYETHIFGTTDAAHDYWIWTTGGQTTYMPTFNKDKDSLKADTNGTYVDAVGGISNRDGNQYNNYKPYTDGETKNDNAIYDADTDNLDNGGTTTVNETHTAQNTLGATLISMNEWKTTYNSQPGEYWVYDTDGWVYWAQAIKPGTATGLLLDGIELNQVMDDTWYYAINVVAQFVTADDVGQNDNTGFYAVADEKPSADAEALLKAIGVQMDGESEPEPEVVYSIAVKADEPAEDEYYDPTSVDSSLIDGETAELVLNYGDTAVTEGVTWRMELIDGGQDDTNTTLQDGTAIDETTGVLTIASDETTWQSGSYNQETYHVIKVTAAVDGTDKASRTFVISGTGAYVSTFDFYEVGTNTMVDSYALEVGTTYDVRGTLFNQTLYTDISNKITASMDPISVDGLTFTITDGENNPVTGAAVENGKFTATEAGTYNVFAEGTLENWGEVNLYKYSVTVVEGSSESGTPEYYTLEPTTDSATYATCGYLMPGDIVKLDLYAVWADGSQTLVTEGVTYNSLYSDYETAEGTVFENGTITVGADEQLNFFDVWAFVDEEDAAPFSVVVGSENMKFSAELYANEENVVYTYRTQGVVASWVDEVEGEQRVVGIADEQLNFTLTPDNRVSPDEESGDFTLSVSAAGEYALSVACCCGVDDHSADIAFTAKESVLGYTVTATANDAQIETFTEGDAYDASLTIWAQQLTNTDITVTLAEGETACFYIDGSSSGAALYNADGTEYSGDVNGAVNSVILKFGEDITVSGTRTVEGVEYYSLPLAIVNPDYDPETSNYRDVRYLDFLIGEVTAE